MLNPAGHLLPYLRGCTLCILSLKTHSPAPSYTQLQLHLFLKEELADEERGALRCHMQQRVS